MRLNALNGSLINTDEINVHDYIFQNLNFDYFEKKVYISLLDPESKNTNITIVYFNVLACNILSCDFWGRSSHVLDWEFLNPDEQLLTIKLFEEKNIHNYSNSKLDDAISYMETVMTLASGDILTITCEYIDFEILP